MGSRKAIRRSIRYFGLACIAALLCWAYAAMPSIAQSIPQANNRTIAQSPLPSPAVDPTGRVSARDAWRKVYEQLPGFPLENQYVNRETGKVDPNNTLVSRLIRYHFYSKGRPANYRLDWKYTMADYLGINEPINPVTYPGADNLRQNPFEHDRAIIQKLTRQQRNALIQALVTVFTPR